MRCVASRIARPTLPTTAQSAPDGARGRRSSAAPAAPEVEGGEAGRPRHQQADHRAVRDHDDRALRARRSPRAPAPPRSARGLRRALSRPMTTSWGCAKNRAMVASRSAAGRYGKPRRSFSCRPAKASSGRPSATATAPPVSRAFGSTTGDDRARRVFRQRGGQRRAAAQPFGRQLPLARRPAGIDGRQRVLHQEPVIHLWLLPRRPLRRARRATSCR